ncbi:MAG: sigma 54-interacting transcriptional regulator [Planctomycetes bacterium]|nr:sigma 54-interacting transcriptional regulator [Planctomycetota bacterium]
MAMIRVLTSWMGHTDLRAMAIGASDAVRAKVSRVAGDLPAPKDGQGPIKTLLNHESFDKVFLLSNYTAELSKAYADWLGVPASVRQVPLDNPTDYGEIFRKVDEAMREFLAGFTRNTLDLSILLSPGTPAMAAVWVLLGKSKYPATFWQTFEGQAWRTDIPFDLVVDFVPDLLRGADAALQKMASKSPQETEGFESIVGDSKAIRLAVGRAKRAALRDVPVLLLGESGTGKEMFARAIHAASPRKAGPFEAVNCAAIPRELLESELFGHVKGAFTGAHAAHKGAFERAHKGTLFLDEIGECDPAIQAKLLRVLQPPHGEGPSIREYHPVGGERAHHSDVRIIAATNRDLLGAVEGGKIREDLYYRLAVISIKLPALRERRSDIPALAAHLLGLINADFTKQEPGYKHKILSASATVFVRRHTWPGNVRQLYNALLQAAVMSEGEELGPEDLAAAIAEVPGTASKLDPMELPLGDDFDLAKHLEAIQRHYLQRAMSESRGVKAEAARLLGIKNYQTLDGQLRRLGVQWNR